MLPLWLFEIHGSRNRGDAKKKSDLDIVVEYKGNEREDTMFNAINDGSLNIEGIKVDVNPIREYETGTMAKYIEKSKKYDAEKANKPIEQTTEKQSSGNKLPEQYLSVLNDAKTQLDNALKTINAKDLDKAKGGVGISAMYFARKFVKTPDTNKPLS